MRIMILFKVWQTSNGMNMRIYTLSGTQEDRCISEFLALAHRKVHQKFNVSVPPMGNEKFMQILELSATC